MKEQIDGGQIELEKFNISKVILMMSWLRPFPVSRVDFNFIVYYIVYYDFFDFHDDVVFFFSSSY